MRLTAPDGMLLGIDRDPEMLERARVRLQPFGDRVITVQGSYADITAIAKTHGFLESDGILFDLGVASWHFDLSGRGFSFRSDEPLDMRFDPTEGSTPTASMIVNRSSRDELERIFRDYGEEPEAKRIARAIIEHRPIHTTRMLADLITKTKRYSRGRVHPATQTFQALRISVNNELELLDGAIPGAVRALRVGGVLVIIAYHSLEDRIVKQAFRSQAQSGFLDVLTPQPRRPSMIDIRENPRVRSAKLRAVTRMQ